MTGDAELAQHYIDLGCLFAAVGSDIGLLARGADQLAAKFKGQNPGGDRGVGGRTWIGRRSNVYRERCNA